MAFGLRCKAAHLRKLYIFDTVLELKRRLRIVLHRFLERQEEKRFDAMQSLILNFDK